MMSMDQWDWKTSAPEFVPGGVQGGVPAPMPGGMQGGMQGGFRGELGPASANPGFAAPFSMQSGFGPGNGAAPAMMASMQGNMQGSLAGGGPPGPPGPGQMFAAAPGVMNMGSSGPMPGCGDFPNGQMMPMGAPQPMPTQTQMPQGGMPGAGCAGTASDEAGQLMQLRAQYEWQIQNKEQKLKDLQRRLGREEVERRKMQADFQRDRQGLMRHLNQLVSAVEKHGISADAQRDEESRLAPNGDSDKFNRLNREGLNSKMEQLNSLLQDRQEKEPPRGGKGSASSKGAGGGKDQRREKGAPAAGKGGKSSSAYSSTSTASAAAAVSKGASSSSARRENQNGAGFGASASASSKLRVSFPADLVEPIHNDLGRGDQSPFSDAMGREAAEEVERTARALEQRTSSAIDQQARETLAALGTNDALEALRRAEDLVHAQGDRCQNLSSVLQSVCRKIKRRAGGHDASGSHSASDLPVPPPPPPKAPPVSREGRGSRESRESREERASSPRDAGRGRGGVEPRSGVGRSHVAEAFASDARDSRTSRDSRESRTQAAASRRGQTGAFPENRYGEGHRQGGGAEHRAAEGHRYVGGPWSTARFEQLARQGAFQLEREDESAGIWSLKIRMQELEPALTDEDMQVYCRWLHNRLHSVRQDLGLRSLRQLRTEVNFSRNGLTDDAVARLLQALQRSDLHVVCLNLYANRLGTVGARHIGDFLWEAPAAVREVHLSHNEIDDDAALEMLRLLADHPKYQPRKASDRSRGSPDELPHPVWLRLNNNWIEQPRKLLRVLETELGITYCLARNRHTCGPTKCGCRSSSGFPLVHLYTFETQDSPGISPPEQGLAEQRQRDRPERSAPSQGSVDKAHPSRRVANEQHPGDYSQAELDAAQSAAAELYLPGSSSVVSALRRSTAASALPSDRVAATAPSARASTAPPLEVAGGDEDGEDSPSAHPVSPGKDEEVLLESGVMRDDACVSSPRADVGEHQEASVLETPPKLSFGPAVSSSLLVPGQTRIEARRAPTRPSSGASVMLRGVPEVTPEPDGQFMGHQLGGRGLGFLHEAGRMPKVEEEEEVSSPLAEKKVKLQAPPKILQRGKGPSDGGLVIPGEAQQAS